MTEHEHNHGPLATNVTVAKKPESEVELTGEVPFEAVAAERPRALRRLARAIELPGFRKGHVPLETVEELVGDMKILEECAGELITHAYRHLVEEHALAVVGRPQLSVTRLAPGSPIGFSITVAVMPQLTLPDYRSVAGQACASMQLPEGVAVSDVEVTEEVNRFFTKLKEHGGEEVVSWELTDAFAQEVLGLPDLAALHERTRERLLADRREHARSARRTAVADALLAQTPFEAPRPLVDVELAQLAGDIQARVARMGATFEAYLAQVNKTEEEFRAELRPDAVKRARLDLILRSIADREMLAPAPVQVEREAAHILEHYPDADLRDVRAFVQSRLVNDLVFTFLDPAQHSTEEPVARADHAS